MRQNIVFSHAGSCSKYYYDRLSLTDMYRAFPELHEKVSTKYTKEEKENVYTLLCTYNKKLTRILYDANTKLLYLFVEPHYGEVINLIDDHFSIEVIKKLSKLNDVLIPVMELVPVYYLSFENKLPVRDVIFSIYCTVDYPDYRQCEVKEAISVCWYDEFRYHDNPIVELLKRESFDETFCIKREDDGWSTINVEWKDVKNGDAYANHNFKQLKIAKSSTIASGYYNKENKGSVLEPRISSGCTRQEYITVNVPVPLNLYSKETLVDDRWFRFIYLLLDRLTKAQREEDKDYFDYIYKVLEERTAEHPESLNELFVLFKLKE